MYLQNLELQPVDAEMFKAEVLTGYQNEPLPTEAEIESDLADNYITAANATAPMLYESSANFMAVRRQNFSAPFAGRNLWRRLREFLCRVLNADSTAGDIINAALDFLLGIIPGGIVLKGILRKILRYILNLGYNGLCPVPAN